MEEANKKVVESSQAHVASGRKPKSSGFYCDHSPVQTKGSKRFKLGRGFSVRWRSEKDYEDEYPITAESNYILSLKADLLHESATQRVGYFRGYVLPIFTQFWDDHLFFIECDCRSAELCDLAEAMLTSGPEFYESLATNGDIFFPRYLEVLPDFRGEKIGITVFAAFAEIARQDFDAFTCCFKPFPLQFIGWNNDKQFFAEKRRAFMSAKRKLTRHYLSSFPTKKFPKGELPDGGGFYYFEMKGNN